jgi:hypothetical protein
MVATGRIAWAVLDEHIAVVICPRGAAVTSPVVLVTDAMACAVLSASWFNGEVAPWGRSTVDAIEIVEAVATPIFTQTEARAVAGAPGIKQVAQSATVV